ncbi:hypothetical protein J7E70_32705 [Variovorax paradoxus]|nr:hypothetical protein [Variovorax paradoxus]MBT2305168.1 hypothetical protein [Variovorax paradoxus]
MSERSRTDEARFAQAVQLVAAAVSASSLSSDRSFDAQTHQDVVQMALIRAYQTLGDARDEIEGHVRSPD